MSRSSHSIADPRPPCSGRLVTAAILAATAAAVVAVGAFKFGVFPHAVPSVVELLHADGVDEEVVALAREHVRRARDEPENAEQRATLAMVYEANELWDEATRSWRAALSLDPRQSLWRYHLAICTRQSGDNDLALELLRRVAGELPDSAAVRHRLGDMLLELGDVPGAAEEFRATIRITPERPNAYVGLAEALLREDGYQRASELCEQALRIAPNYKRAHYNLGLAYRGLGRKEEAAVELAEGLGAGKDTIPDLLASQIESYRTSYSVRLIEASRLEKAGQPAAAARLLEQVVVKHPDDVSALTNLAATYVQLARIEEAVALLERAKKVDPEKFAIYINLAAAELARDRPSTALSYADEAAKRAPTIGQIFYVRARALARLGRWGEAYDALHTSIGLDAGSGLSYLLLGDACLNLGLHSECVEHFDSATRLMPSQAAAHIGLARAWLRVDEPQKANASFLRARKLAPDSPLVAHLASELAADGY